MFRKWKTVTVTASVSVLMLLGVSMAPHAAELHNGCANSHATIATATNAPLAAASAKEVAAAPQKQHKSVLDAEALERPLSYFKDVASSEDEEADIDVRSGAVVLALKALIATLLSTII